MTAALSIWHEPYAFLPDGRTVRRWTFGCDSAVTVEMLDLGATLHTLRAPDRDGRRANVVLGAAKVADLLGPARYFGATVGRYANRIARAELPIDKAVHRLAGHPVGPTLHGGADGFDNRLWQAQEIREPGRVGARFELHSPDGDQGFPGALDVTVDYLLDSAGELTIEYRATTDAATVVNLTNHAYFNLAGENSGETVLDHLLQVDADAYSPVDPDLLPLGSPAPVEGTPFDLTDTCVIGEAIAADHAQLRLAGGGYDHNWVLREATSLRRAAVLSHPGSGRRLECLTTEPGIQIYTANHFDGTSSGLGGRPYGAFAGVALETQHFPDSPHHPDYPSTVLRPGEEYRSTTRYRFSAM
ncbi:aldose epimerase family protein [Kitasatospora sp. McL0602]|uniref:aldose epimerase family protein n=1 Tax=Kitasatospora sp. McL0602 TaxID=3439530 RepID=UPI003F8965DC